MRRTLVALSTAAAVALAGTGVAQAQDLPEEVAYGSQGMELLSSGSPTETEATEGARLIAADYAVGSGGLFLIGLALYHLAAFLPQDMKIPLSNA